MLYTPAIFNYQRRKTREVKVGNVGVGGSNPIRVQSMTISDTKDTAAVVAETRQLVEAGCEIVRITAPTIHHAENLKEIKAALRKEGLRVPLVADIHFTPQAAMIAADYVEKVRINPGNYADRKLFAIKEYTDSEYAAELEHMAEKFLPLVRKCKANGVALRIGTNHGSLSDRIMNRFGDTPEGMVESALEFVKLCELENFYDVIFSMKASSPFTMISAYRLLVQRLNETGRDYPLHLGVTEAGEGEDGRIKSALGIGALLEDGIGDTVRVSLTEDSVYEIPVAQALVKKYNDLFQKNPQLLDTSVAADCGEVFWDTIHRKRRDSAPLQEGVFKFGANQTMGVMFSAAQREITKSEPEIAKLKKDEVAPDLIFYTDQSQDMGFRLLSFSSIEELKSSFEKFCEVKNILVALNLKGAQDYVQQYRRLAVELKKRDLAWPIHLSIDAAAMAEPALEVTAMLGALLADGIGDSIEIQSLPLEEASRLAFNILQAGRLRISKAEFISCPSCGRTLFDLQSTTRRIREKTGHLKGVKIAIMGCIVNGPGEMADADFGYVGGGPGKIHLYVGKDCVQKNIPAEIADEKLIDLIKGHGRWVDMPAS